MFAIDFLHYYMIKYMAVKVFATDGQAGVTAWKQKSLKVDRLGSLPIIA